ncbi:MAG: metal ABC transporter solute-binding protein, Zn/Mn family [Phycisphaerae bacterium]
MTRLRFQSLLCISSLVPLFVAGCDRSVTGRDARNGADRLSVAVSIPPQAEFVERVGGTHVDVLVLIGAGQSPATYDPTLKQLSRLSKSHVYFRIGVPCEERLLPRLAEIAGEMKIVDTRRGIPLRSMDEEPHGEHDRHEHAHGDHHHADQPDPHIWLSPRLAKDQARTIADTLKRLDPAHADDYERNLLSFHADLDALDSRLADLLAPMRGKPFFVYHPAYGYLADAYGLRQVAVETGGREPSAKELASLIAQARQAGVRLILVQEQFASGSARAVAEAIGGAVVRVDPLARDYLANLWEMAAAIARATSTRPDHPEQPVSNRPQSRAPQASAGAVTPDTLRSVQTASPVVPIGYPYRTSMRMHFS